MYRQIKNCRICDGNLKEVLNLGKLYPSGFIGDEYGFKNQKAPLVLSKCLNCGLVQLKHTVQLDTMYRQYWYSSSLNKSMVGSLRDVAEGVEARIELNDLDTVIDIGCNDGTLFTLYTNNNIEKVGYDPALNLASDAKEHCDYFFNDYFSSNNWFEGKKAKVITAIAMFYDLEDPNKFLNDVVEVLDENGIFVVQFTDLMSMFRIMAFDNICHEHLEYYTLEVLSNLFSQHGLEIFDVEQNDVNGGSMRAYACFTGKRKISSNVEIALMKETWYFNIESFLSFENKIGMYKSTILHFLAKAGMEDKTIFVLGASTKGNTLLQYFGITDSIIPYAAEVNKEKFGLKTLGSDIIIIREEDALKLNPDYLLVLPWHFIDTFIENLGAYLEKGGKLIVPMPIPCVVEKIGEEIVWTLLTKQLES